MNEELELERLLDDGARAFSVKLARLHETTEYIRDADIQSLEQTIDEIHAIDMECADIERSISDCCRRLAGKLGVEDPPPTLSGLLDAMGDCPAAMSLRNRRERLLIVLKELKETSAKTFRLAEDVFDYNRKLVEALFGSEKGDIYSASGEMKKGRNQAAFERSV